MIPYVVGPGGGVYYQSAVKEIVGGLTAPQNGMMNNRKLPMDMNKNRYEKPVQTPSWGT